MSESMKLFKRENGIYYVRISSQKRISLGTKDRREAEKLYREVKKQYHKGKLYILEGKKNIYLAEAIKDFLHYQSQVNTIKTAKRYKDSLNRFIEILGDKYLHKYTIKDIDFFKAERIKQVKKVSVNVDLRNIRAFFNKCLEWNYIQDTPTKKIKMCVVDKQLPAILSQDEIKKLFDVIDNETYKVLFACYVYTGRRRNEILNLSLKNIDMVNHRLKYYNQKKKYYNEIPIAEPLQKILYPYIENNKFKINGNPDKRIFKINPDTITHKFKKYFRMIDREDLKLHSLRHTFASHLVMANVPLKQIQELLDHSDISTTLVYAHVSKEYTKKVIEKLPY